MEYLPSITFPDLTEDDYGLNEVWGMTTAKRHIIVVLAEKATVGEVNDLLAQTNGLLAGSIRELLTIVIELTGDVTSERLVVTVDEMNSHSAVVAAAPDTLLEPTITPPPPTVLGYPATEYSWGPPAGGNWGLEFIRAPTAWNLKKALEREGAASVTVGILDNSFADHVDLPTLSVVDGFGDPGGTSHGTYVAGIIGAAWGNKSYIDGITPFVTLVGTRDVSRAPTLALGKHVIEALYLLQPYGPRLANASLGYTVASMPCDTYAGVVEQSGRVFAEVIKRINRDQAMLMVVGAGNDACPAHFASPMAWAAVNEPSLHDDIVIAEALAPPPASTWDPVRAEYSNVSGGGVFAPGSYILSTAEIGVESSSGTSMAAPHVTGVAAWLLAIEPSLTNHELRQLLTEQPFARSISDPLSTTSTVLDMLGATYGIDELRGNTRVLTMMMDMDDGTTDGFRRVEYDNSGQPMTPEVHEDGPPDGNVDLRDFRRLRDSFLLMQGQALDGAENHPKRDLNDDGVVSSAHEEYFPRANVNGDADFSGTPPILLGETLFDMDLFARAYEPADDDPQKWAAEELYYLMDSADIIVRASAALDAAGADSLRLTIDGVNTDATLDPSSHVSDLFITGDEVVLSTPLRQNVSVHYRCVSTDREFEEQVLSFPDLDPGSDTMVAISDCGPSTPRAVPLTEDVLLCGLPPEPFEIGNLARDSAGGLYIRFDCVGDERYEPDSLTPTTYVNFASAVAYSADEGLTWERVWQQTRWFIPGPSATSYPLTDTVSSGGIGLQPVADGAGVYTFYQIEHVNLSVTEEYELHGVHVTPEGEASDWVISDDTELKLRWTASGGRTNYQVFWGTGDRAFLSDDGGVTLSELTEFGDAESFPNLLIEDPFGNLYAQAQSAGLEGVPYVWYFDAEQFVPTLSIVNQGDYFTTLTGSESYWFVWDGNLIIARPEGLAVLVDFIPQHLLQGRESDVETVFVLPAPDSADTAEVTRLITDGGLTYTDLTKGPQGLDTEIYDDAVERQAACACPVTVIQHTGYSEIIDGYKQFRLLAALGITLANETVGHPATLPDPLHPDLVYAPAQVLSAYVAGATSDEPVILVQEADGVFVYEHSSEMRSWRKTTLSSLPFYGVSRVHRTFPPQEATDFQFFLETSAMELEGHWFGPVRQLIYSFYALP